MATIHVTKRDGRREVLNLDKINRVLAWAAEGLKVSASEVAISSKIQFFDGIPTEMIHETLIKTAADMISEVTPDYQYMASRLAVFNLRKRVYGEYTPCRLYDHVVRMVDSGRYDRALLTDYTEAEFDEMESFIDHERDLKFAYAGIQQVQSKYLVRDRTQKNTIYETPQMMYVLIGACLFSGYPKTTRMNYVRRFYEAVSLFKISLPTPILGGVRTPTRQFSSCVLIECGDSIRSINAATSALVEYVSLRAGIGINAGRIRGLGSKIRGGEAFHTGCVPFYKMFQAATKSCSQGGIRGGAATLFYPMWHIEVESLLVLKNNRGTEDNRVRHMDYGIQLNRLMYERLVNEDVITLFSPNDVPGLYDAYFADQDEFRRLYEAAEADPSIRKKQVRAKDLFSLFGMERSSTGRIYPMNVDHANQHGPFNPKKAPVRQSNLCMEIALPTVPLEHIFDENGEIALCTLAAFNLGELADDRLHEIEDLADVIVRALDALLDYQDYPLPAARKGAQRRRPLGVGVINYAYYLAKHGARYSDGSGLGLTHRLAEAIQFYLLKASNQLAKEFGKCDAFDDTTYADGVMPIDRYYGKHLDAICNEPLRMPWDALRQEIVQHGLRNSTLTALMPSESSSQVSNATNGVEAPRGLISVKGSKEGLFKQVVPEINKLRFQYELIWEVKSNTGYLQLMGVWQKFVDQAISSNTNYDPHNYPNRRVPLSLILKDLLTAYQLGLKTLYYHNTRDHSSSDTEAEDDGCAGGACKI